MLECAVRVQFAHLFQVCLQQAGQRRAGGRRAPERPDAGFEFGLLLRIGMVQRVESGAGVSVDIPERLVLLRQVVEQLDYDGVLENIGMIAGVKGVTITEHGGGE